jgi:membrane-bound ClpP family serine protease
MKNALYVIGGLLILGGMVWVLQGVNILPGSFMTGQIQWAYNGAIAIAIGITLILFGRRRG